MKTNKKQEMLCTGCVWASLRCGNIVACLFPSCVVDNGTDRITGKKARGQKEAFLEKIEIT